MTVATKAPATQRILGAARTLVARGGAAEISMGDVATTAGVSKALVHYHFHDKESLLRALVEDVGHAVLGRTRQAMVGASQMHVLDAYWSWLEGELRVGDVRILMSLAEYDSEQVRSACRRILAERRDASAEQMALVFSRLGLTPSVPTDLIADTALAFADGLAAVHALDPGRNPRPAFDVMWLALLTLAE